MWKSIGAAITILIFATLASPVAAQEASTTTSPTSTAIEESVSGGQSNAVPDSATDPNNATTTTQAIGRSPEEGVVDPLLNKGRVGEEEVDPEAETEVGPDAQAYSSQPQYQPPQVLVDEVAAAQVRLEEAESTYSEAIEIVRGLRQKQKVLVAEVEALDRDSAFLIEEAERIRQTTEDRAVADFLFNSQDFGAAPGSGPTIEEQIERNKIATIIEFDSRELERYEAVRSRISAESQLLIDEAAKIEELIESASDAVFFKRVAKDQAQIEFEAFSAGSQVFVNGVVFPISGTVSLPLIDSYGFPRAPGTPDAHWHEGIDIFAPRGTPLVATESGVVNRVGVARLGGKKLWITGDSGVDWYYAHLEDFAPGLANGQRVEAGDLVGYVGDSGNAVGTPPHLHMELHPNGARPINPFPLLASVVRTEQSLGINGFAPEPPHEPLSSPVVPAAPAADSSRVS